MRKTTIMRRDGDEVRKVRHPSSLRREIPPGTLRRREELEGVKGQLKTRPRKNGMLKGEKG